MLRNAEGSQETLFEQLQVAYFLNAQQLTQAHQEIQQLKAKQQQFTITITGLEEEIARLKEQLTLAQDRHFGKKSEVVVGEASVEETASALQTVAGYTRQKKKKSCGRKIDIASLPKHCIHHDLAQSHQICQGCQNPLHRIGTEVAQQVEVLPQYLYVAEHIRYKYGCRHCQTVTMAPKEKSAIAKALAGNSLLAEILVNKYQYHLPLYRQSKILASYGALIPDNTLGNWVTQVGLGLMPLYEALWKVVLTFNRYLQVDETPIQVLQTGKKGYLWAYFAPLIAKGVVVFELSLTRSGEVAEKRLAAFNGLLQTDGYAGYNGLRQQDTITGLGCLTHARRKFSEVLKITKNAEGIAAQAIERLKPLYVLERQMRENHYPFSIRKRLRQKIAWPILKAFHAWLKKCLPQIPPKSQLAKAVAYTLNQWPYIIRYARHGMAEIDTNAVENKIRDIASGRKNWLFMAHEDSGKIHAVFYSLTLTAILNDLNPRLYLHYVITKIEDLRKGKIDPMTLLPHTIDRVVLQQFAQDLLEDSKKVLNNLKV